MIELKDTEISDVSGGVAPMLIVWGTYTFLSPFMALGFAASASTRTR